jgi:hypothetical protein
LEQPQQQQQAHKRSLKERLLPASRIRVFKLAMPDSLFEFATRIPILERIVIRQYFKRRFWEKWLATAQESLQGMTPLEAARTPEGRVLLDRVFLQWKVTGEKSRWELWRARIYLRRQSRATAD